MTDPAFDLDEYAERSSPRRSLTAQEKVRQYATAHKSQYVIGDCLDVDGTLIKDVELRVTPPIPGKPKDELPRAVFISSAPAPEPKEAKR